MHRQVKTAQRRLALKETRFENARLAQLGVEVISFRYLFDHTTPDELGQPERMHFYLLLLVTAGRGSHTVDSVTHRLSSGSIVLIRPGQVQQWHLDERYRAEIVLFNPHALRPEGAFAGGVADLDGCPTAVRVPRGQLGRVLADLSTLRSEIQRFDGSAVDSALVHHLLLAVLLRVLRWGLSRGGDPATSRGPYHAFRRTVEMDFRRLHRVSDYARRLGYSASTLNRACLRAEGRTAKAVVDQRIALEAQRLLIHSRASLMEVCHYLGFSEASNFARFFARVTGSSPHAVRCSHKSRRAPS